MTLKPAPTVGFISAPAWFDPAPSEFPTVVKEAVRTQQAPLLLPDFDYRLESIASVQSDLNHCARSLNAMGCDLVAQVGSPFAWAGTETEAEARSRNSSMAEVSSAAAMMTGLAIIDGLRALGATTIAVTCTYYDRTWRDAFASFLVKCGFTVDHVSTLSDQKLIEPDASMKDYGWSMTHDLTCNSIGAVSKASPHADAIVVTGAGARTLDILCDMERQTRRPIVAADTILYWAIARVLNLSVKPVMGSLSNLSKP